VLLVERHPTHLARDAAGLRHAGCDIVQATSGSEALSLLRGCDFDLILLDTDLPDLDGAEVCRRIRADPRSALMPVILVADSARGCDVQAGLAAGASDCLRKPYAPGELLSRATCALENKRLTDQLDDAETVVYALATMVEGRDPKTGEHCARLSRTTRVLGEALGLGAADLLALEKGSVLHDIGKIAIPDRILLKEGPLTDDEWLVMKSHAEVGAGMCAGLKSIRDVVPIVRHHHERWDGSGYPDGLRGEEIPLVVRVFQFADIYDALRHRRTYAGAMSAGAIVGVLHDEIRLGWRDPRIGEVVLGLLRDEPDILDRASHGEQPEG
jgi:putative two-component system response regulator